MDSRTAHRLPRGTQDEACTLFLDMEVNRLILRVTLPAIFAEVLPQRLIYAKRRLLRNHGKELTAVNSLVNQIAFGAEWLTTTQENFACAHAAYRQLRAAVFQPITLNEACRLLNKSDKDLASLQPEPGLRIPCNHRGKTYSVPAWKLSDFLQLAGSAQQSRTLG